MNLPTATALRAGWAEAGRSVLASRAPGRIIGPALVLAVLFIAADAAFGPSGLRRTSLTLAIAILILWAPRAAHRAISDEVARETWEMQCGSVASPLAFAAAKLVGACASWAWPFAICVGAHVFTTLAGGAVAVTPAVLASVWIFNLAATALACALALTCAAGAALRKSTGHASALLSHLLAAAVLIPLLITADDRIWPGALGGAVGFNYTTPFHFWGLTLPLGLFALLSVFVFAALALVALRALIARAFSHPPSPLTAFTCTGILVLYLLGLLSNVDATVSEPIARSSARIRIAFAAIYVFAAIAYVQAFLCPFDPVGTRRFLRNPYARARLGDAPRSILAGITGIAAVLAYTWPDFAVINVNVCVKDKDDYSMITKIITSWCETGEIDAIALSLPALLLRDLGFIWALRTHFPRLSDTAIALYLLTCAWVLPILIGNAGAPPWVNAPLASVLFILDAPAITRVVAPLVLACTLWTLAAWGWRRNFRVQSS